MTQLNCSARPANNGLCTALWRHSANDVISLSPTATTVELSWTELHCRCELSIIPCWHDQANIQQTHSKYMCMMCALIARCLRDVCLMIAWSCKWGIRDTLSQKHFAAHNHNKKETLCYRMYILHLCNHWILHVNSFHCIAFCCVMTTDMQHSDGWMSRRQRRSTLAVLLRRWPLKTPLNLNYNVTFHNQSINQSFYLFEHT